MRFPVWQHHVFIHARYGNGMNDKERTSTLTEQTTEFQCQEQPKTMTCSWGSGRHHHEYTSIQTLLGHQLLPHHGHIFK
jgi:hypothetical protein